MVGRGSQGQVRVRVMRGAVGRGYSFKRWPAIWQRWSLHYLQLICHFAREGLEYTPVPTVPPNGRVGRA
jgi:hypothetical protein